jgi:hypothetical protein
MDTFHGHLSFIRGLRKFITRGYVARMYIVTLYYLGNDEKKKSLQTQNSIGTNFCPQHFQTWLAESVDAKLRCRRLTVLY